MITPIGTALWAHLDEIKVSDYNADKYEISLVLNEQDAATLRGQMEPSLEEAFKTLASMGKEGGDISKIRAKVHQYGRPHLDKDGQDSGAVRFTFKTKIQPTLIDAGRNPIPISTKIGNGSQIRLKLGTGKRPWGPTGGKYGASFYPNIVQITKLVEGFGDTSEFDDVEGGFEFTPGAGEFADAPAASESPSNGTGDY